MLEYRCRLSRQRLIFPCSMARSRREQAASSTHTSRILSSSISLKTVPLIWLGLRATQLNTGMRNLVLIGFLIFTAKDSRGEEVAGCPRAEKHPACPAAASQSAFQPRGKNRPERHHHTGQPGKILLPREANAAGRLHPAPSGGSRAGPCRTASAPAALKSPLKETCCYFITARLCADLKAQAIFKPYGKRREWSVLRRAEPSPA